MAPGEDNKKKIEEEADLFSQLPGYTPFAASANQPLAKQKAQGQDQAEQNSSLPSNQAGQTGQNPWFPNQAASSQAPVYPVNPGYVGPAEPLAPSDIVLPKLRPQDDPNSSEYIPKTPVLNAPIADPHSPWVPVPEPTWELFVEQNLNQAPRQPQDLPKKALPAGGSQANPILFNALPIVTGESYQPPEPAWPGAPQVADQNSAPFSQSGQQNSQPVWPGMSEGAGQGAFQNSSENPDPQLQQGNASEVFRGQFQPAEVPPQPAWPNASPYGKDAAEKNSPKWRNKLLKQSEAKAEPVPQSLNLGFNKNDIVGIATYNLNVTKDILTNPQGYFQTMPLSGGYGEPLLYTVFACILSSLMCAIAKLNPFMFFWAFIIGFLSVALGAVIVDQAFRRMGGKGDLEGTFRVLAYGKATFVISWIALGPLSLGLMLATMITGYMNYIGLMRVHGLSPKSTIIIVALMSVLSLIFRWTCPGV